MAALQATAARRPLPSGEAGGQLGLFAPGSQVEMALQQQAQYLPALGIDQLFEPVVRQCRRCLAFQLGDEGLEGLPRSLKVSCRAGVIRFHWALLPDGRMRSHSRT
jgi:hypothetical protein